MTYDAYETKDDTVGSVGDIKALVEKQARTFEAFKAAHEAELRDLKCGAGEDPLTVRTVEKTAEEVVKLSSAIANLETAINRPGTRTPLGGGEDRAYRSAFDRFVRKGERALSGGDMQLLEEKAISIGTGQDGGYAVPAVIDQEIERQMGDLSPMRSICRVVQVASETYTKLVSKNGGGAAWVSEAGGRPETANPSFHQVTPSMGELYAFPFATQRALDDVMFDVEQFLFEDIAVDFAEKEGEAFISGDGANKPSGLLTATFSANGDDSRAFGQVEEIATGVAGDWAAADPSDDLIELKSRLKEIYRPNGRFLMNAKTLASILKFKDANGQYLWQPQMAYGENPTIWGSPYTLNEAMPDMGTDAHAVLFGDFERAYTIVDRVGTRVLRDPYSAKPHVGFYATKRVGGALVNDHAVKALRFGA